MGRPKTIAGASGRTWALCACRNDAHSAIWRRYVKRARMRLIRRDEKRHIAYSQEAA